MSAEIAELTELEDLAAAAELFAVVWGRAGEPPINADVLRAMSRSGQYIAGARADGRLIGAIVGWIGMHRGSALHLHSHILGVLPDREAAGLGFALKQHQRTWCLERGIPSVEWTYDPLVRRNAHFNLAKLGADAAEYLVNFYGPMGDAINAGDESDRILVRWELESEKARGAAEGPARGAGDGATESGHPHRAITVTADGSPEVLDIKGKRLDCQVPADIVALRRANPAQARAWRQALRATLGKAMEEGYRVTGFTRDGWYTLERG